MNDKMDAYYLHIAEDNRPYPRKMYQMFFVETDNRKKVNKDNFEFCEKVYPNKKDLYDAYCKLTLALAKSVYIEDRADINEIFEKICNLFDVEMSCLRILTDEESEVLDRILFYKDDNFKIVPNDIREEFDKFADKNRSVNDISPESLDKIQSRFESWMALHFRVDGSDYNDLNMKFRNSEGLKKVHEEIISEYTKAVKAFITAYITEDEKPAENEHDKMYELGIILHKRAKDYVADIEANLTEADKTKYENRITLLLKETEENNGALTAYNKFINDYVHVDVNYNRYDEIREDKHNKILAAAHYLRKEQAEIQYDIITAES